MVAVEVPRIVIFFEDDLSKEDERPGDVDAVGRPPFVPNTEIGIPSLLSRGAFHEAVLGGFRESLVTTLAGGRDSHDLEPSADRQSIVKDQPGKRPHLVWPGVVPHHGNDLGNRQVPEVQILYEEARSHTQPGVKNTLPQGGWGPFEFGCCEHPVDILSGWAHPVNWKPNLVGFVSKEFLPGLSS
ncbi:unnamed protein product [Sphagnum jensenii]|uniref:Uncharacterized protein n=1 Tax=Sphagnum jensenii TaxID=128206 RepID=A0ABP1BHN1_9BRYO